MTKCIIVGFDGLRQDSITQETMPHLWAFIHRSFWCRGHRAVFPVETYVNHPSIFTGALPRHHGLIANAYYNRPGTADTPLFDGSSVESIEANNRRDALFSVATLGDYLGRKGLTMRVIGSNSCGSTRLKHHRADQYPGHLNLPVRDIARLLPSAEAEVWRGLHGAGYPLAKPDEAGNRAVMESFFKVELPRGLADLTVLWLGEPDHSSHPDGPGGPRTLIALASADEQFGRLLEWWQAHEEDVALVALSDHGHVIIERYSDIRGALTASGLRLVSPFELKDGADLEEADLVVAGDYCGGLWSAKVGDLAAIRGGQPKFCKTTRISACSFPPARN